MDSKHHSNNNFLKRGKGKKSEVTKYDFFSYYRKHTQYTRLGRTQYSRFLKDLLIAFSETIVKENLELKLGKNGYIRIQAKKLNFLNKEGKLQKSLKPNWKKTWEYWHNQYPDLTKDEIVEIKDKKVIYHDNAHSNQEFYRHFWDKVTAKLKYKRFYRFKPSRQYSRLIAEIVKDPNRTVFYYG
jgi:hypothetical protein